MAISGERRCVCIAFYQKNKDYSIRRQKFLCPQRIDIPNFVSIYGCNYSL